MVDKSAADTLLLAMPRQLYGQKAAIIGKVVESPKGMVLLETAIGGSRIIDTLQREQLPRIC